MADFESRQPDWISYLEALTGMTSVTTPRPGISTPLDNLMGLAVAAEVRSAWTLPPLPSSHMDGYAVRAHDLEMHARGDTCRLRVVGASRPGTPWKDALEPGAAVRIMTGALLPPESDTVVPVEETDRESGDPSHVRITVKDPKPGRFVRPAGEEATQGQILAEAGDTVHTGLLALLATTGAEAVPAHPAPRIAVVVTGDELVEPGRAAALEGGLLRADVLSPTLPWLIRHAGGDALPPVRVPDRTADLERAFVALRDEADLIITTGGASMGDRDLVKHVLDEMGFQLGFWRIRMRPGSPVGFGFLPRSAHLDPVPVLNLPGNPVSALVTGFVLGWPLIRHLGGHRRQTLPRIRAVLQQELGGPEHLTRFFRVRLHPTGDGRWNATPSAPQGSGNVRSLALADGLAVVSEGDPAPDVGSEVEVLLLPHAGWEEYP